MKDGNQVWYEMSRTLNIGNFENLKFSIGESRSADGEESSEEVYKSVRKDVNARMTAIITKLKKDTDNQE